MRSPIDVQPSARATAALFTVAGVLLTLRASLEAHQRLGSDLVHISPLLLGVLLLTLATFIATAKVLTFTQYTHHIGSVLRDRVFSAGRNWENDPMRSFFELFTCISVTWSTLAASNRLALSLVCGVVSSWLVIFVGEAFTDSLRKLEKLSRDGRVDHVPADALKKRIGCSASVLCLYVLSALSLIYQHVNDLVLASILAATMFFALNVASKVLTAFRPTREIGEVLQDRILCSRNNWEAHPLRSAIELCVCMGVTLRTLGLYGQILLALQAGVAAGIAAVLLCELCFSSPERVAYLLSAFARKYAPYAMGTALAFAACAPVVPASERMGASRPL